MLVVHIVFDTDTTTTAFKGQASMGHAPAEESYNYTTYAGCLQQGIT